MEWLRELPIQRLQNTKEEYDYTSHLSQPVAQNAFEKGHNIHFEDTEVLVKTSGYYDKESYGKWATPWLYERRWWL